LLHDMNSCFSNLNSQPKILKLDDKDQQVCGGSLNLMILMLLWILVNLK
jgi:hypothetical protein